MLPIILVDASPGSLMGHVWMPFLIGCACAKEDVAVRTRVKSHKIINMVIIMSACAASVWMWTQSLAVARLNKNSGVSLYMGALQRVRNPDLMSQLVSYMKAAPDFDPNSSSLRAALTIARMTCGWFMHWPELAWSMRSSPPSSVDMDALDAVLRRSPFQDTPYEDLATIDPANLSPALRTRKARIEQASDDSSSIEGAAAIWRQTIAASIERPLLEAEKRRYLVILERYPEIPGIAAVGLWLYARGILDNQAVFYRIRMGLRLARTDSSLFMNMINNLTVQQRERLMELDHDLQLGLPQIKGGR
jgi:hypothetical protein